MCAQDFLLWYGDNGQENSCKTSVANVLDNNILLTVDVPEILQAPESAVVYLDQSAVFTCETVGGLTGWTVNGTILQSLPPEIRNDLHVSPTSTDEGTVVEELTIPARAEYNGTRVQCLVVILGGSSDESENATLMIQGIYLLHEVYVCMLTASVLVVKFKATFF